MAERTHTVQTRTKTSSLADSGSYKLPGAASLYEQLDKLILVCLRDGRNFLGYLRSFDQYANLILDKTVERLTVEDSFADIPLGLFIVRGENVMLLGEVDEKKQSEFGDNMKQVSEREIRRALAAIEEDEQALRRGERLDWPIPEEY